jgi:acyl carrier protein
MPTDHAFKKEALFEEILALVREHSIDPDVDATELAPIETLGIDSIDLMEIIFRLEEHHGVAISPKGLMGRETLGQIVDYAYETITA